MASLAHLLSIDQLSTPRGPDGHTPVLNVLFPLLQVSLLASLVLYLQLGTYWAAWMFVGILLLWHTCILTRLGLSLVRYYAGERRLGFTLTPLCSEETAVALVACVWYGVLGFAFSLPLAMLSVCWTFTALCVYGWFCHHAG